jgi:phasin family protein
VEAVIAAAKPAETAVAKIPAPAVEAKPEEKPQAKPVAAVRVTKTRPVKAAKSVKKARPAKAAKSVRKARPTKAAKIMTQTRPARTAATKTIRKSVRAGVQTIRGVETMATKTTNEAAFFAADQFKNVFGDVNARAKTAVEKSAKIVEELTDIARGNVEAMVASSKVAAKGVETLSQDAAEYSRKSFEEASATLKSFAEVKSATDFFKLQSDFARSAFDAAVAESARVSEAFIKIAGDAAEPITSRYTVAAERVKTLAA